MARILLVDDAHLSLQLMYYHLRRQGHTIGMAYNGVEAISYLEANQVDLLITDINMPYMDGLALLDWLRADERYQSLPVIVITASARHKLEQAAVQKGASGFLTQPFSSSDLDRLLEACLGAGNRQPGEGGSSQEPALVQNSIQPGRNGK
jgi:CheY-like chemotaxis protein